MPTVYAKCHKGVFQKSLKNAFKMVIWILLETHPGFTGNQGTILAQIIGNLLKLSELKLALILLDLNGQKSLCQKRKKKARLYLSGWLTISQGRRKLLQSGWARPKIILLGVKSEWGSTPFHERLSKKVGSALPNKETSINDVRFLGG